MRKIQLFPEEVISTLAEPLNEGLISSYLRLYYRRSCTLPRVIVAGKAHSPKDYGFPESAAYLILDGNHRSVCSALMRGRVYAYEAEGDSDLSLIKKMSDLGEIDPWPHEEKSVSDIIRKAYRFVSLKSTLEEQIRKMISIKELDLENLPAYITESIML